MKKYIEIQREAFVDGIIDAYNDYLNNSRKRFCIDDKEFLAKLYDLSYKYGYEKIYNILLLINKKI